MRLLGIFPIFLRRRALPGPPNAPTVLLLHGWTASADLQFFTAYETLAAMLFAGATRYRVPWDFVLALLAGAAVDRLLARRSSAIRSAISA